MKPKKPIPSSARTFKVMYAEVPVSLHDRIAIAANAKDLKLVAVIRQALELWLRENAS